ncbi:hypothetical protein EPUS_08395 [Endocarpon pusillum Z07020]|uniref:Enhancer of polycomb-like protein n=1 Tax=Endocarpon pusillum (strain Z07020 / HMAS-L-300199) TaxID=1263415 RepID=U1HFZ8_ENDPU|nr:uncharacterized protein EPUS_08395 [Endocarpon pusillum Z07020]ERF69045.1 hypothetical protein EPUS_08395 [Endocarpon pusillum Z07020]
MSTRALGRHTRPKKLSPKQNVQIFRESDVDLQPDLDASRGVTTVETGVEKAEESEYHLQQAINAAQAAVTGGRFKEAHIPTPPTIASNVQYDVLYPARFEQPATYIRSSSTVEDHCNGSLYCMDEADEIALQKINLHLPSELKPCTEDQFEEVMGFFEETVHTKQPYASVDNAPVLPLEEFEEQFEESVAPTVRRLAKFIYDHWKSRRLDSANHNLQPSLKDTDDADPYVCFRRREIRQIRKTRHRDAQSAEKLRRLRKELEDARHIMAMVKQREIMRSEVLSIDKLLFKQRSDVKETKRKLGIKGDDEDLINQKPKKKIVDSPGQGLSPQMRFPMSGRGGPGEDMRLLEDWQAERAKAIQREIQQNVEKHIRWNEGFVDKTRAPLTPVSPKLFASNSDFRQAMPATEYLPTPPASVASESPPVDSVADVDSPSHHLSPPLRYASPAGDDSSVPMPSFRRRVGRGGRIMFDRRIPFRSKEADDDRVAERYKFDSDDERVEEDPTDHQVELMKQRAFLFSRARETDSANTQASRRALVDAAPSQNVQTATASVIGQQSSNQHQ